MPIDPHHPGVNGNSKMTHDDRDDQDHNEEKGRAEQGAVNTNTSEDSGMQRDEEGR